MWCFNIGTRVLFSLSLGQISSWFFFYSATTETMQWFHPKMLGDLQYHRRASRTPRPAYDVRSSSLAGAMMHHTVTASTSSTSRRAADRASPSFDYARARCECKCTVARHDHFYISHRGMGGPMLHACKSNTVQRSRRRITEAG